MNQNLPSDYPSYTSGTSETPLPGMIIGEILDRPAAKYPAREALFALHQNISWTYKKFQQKVDETARTFLAIGVHKGHHEALLIDNSEDDTD
ncbi:hypothetical protein C9974_05555 [Marinobacter sp. B9-2]|jgi:fatty-acyl-CoA synthase|nr:hypothetical protein C9974_05555 [Marinobacter sp. B9-2]